LSKLDCTDEKEWCVCCDEPVGYGEVKVEEDIEEADEYVGVDITDVDEEANEERDDMGVVELEVW